MQGLVMVPIQGMVVHVLAPGAEMAYVPFLALWPVAVWPFPNYAGYSDSVGVRARGGLADQTAPGYSVLIPRQIPEEKFH